MKKRIVTAALAAAIATTAHAAPPGNLDGASGRIFEVNLANRTFELLKEIEYDPVTAAGRSRFTVHWTDETVITMVRECDGFDEISKPVMANFYGIHAADMKAFETGEPFVARVAVLHAGAGSVEDIEGEKTGIFGWFTPGKGVREGLLRVGDREVPVSLRPRNWRIFLRAPLAAERLGDGFWKTTLQGSADDAGRFVVSRMEVEALPDPRLLDDPKQPRVLVIGDSISMNYHEEAKQALDGVANYHRIDGNAATSGHGAKNAELWLGNYKEKGLHWDVIQFNHGLHDLRQTYEAKTETWGPPQLSIEEYQANLERLIAVLKQTGATLVWASTTPVQRDILGQYARRKGAAAEYNAAALEVMQRHPEIIINDLHGVVAGSPAFDRWRETADVHFYQPAERQALGGAVATAVRKAVASRGK